MRVCVVVNKMNQQCVQSESCSRQTRIFKKIITIDSTQYFNMGVNSPEGRCIDRNIKEILFIVPESWSWQVLLNKSKFSIDAPTFTKIDYKKIIFFHI